MRTDHHTRATTGSHAAHLIGLAALLITLTGCQAVLEAVLGGGGVAPTEADIAVGVTDINGLARVESAAGVNDFQVTSGATGERQVGIRLRVAVFGRSRMLMAEDPAGQHLPVAVPLIGESTVRRLILPPTTTTGTNLTTVSGDFDLSAYTYVGTLTEEDIRQRLKSGPDEAVLLYLYNPARPLALTGAPLQAYATPFANVTILKAAAEPEDAQLALVVVSLEFAAYDGWSNRGIDRYLSGRIGQGADTDLRGDLAFHWSYPVFDIFPAGETLDLGTDDELLMRVNWRSENPDPPPPWRFFVTSDDEHLTVDPEAFALDPDTPPAEVTITINRADQPIGSYKATLFIQPFSDAFGMIEQGVTRVVSWEVAAAVPTATPAPGVEAISVVPESPRTGDRLQVTAAGFDPSENVLFEFIGVTDTIRDALAAADAEGSFQYVLDLARVDAGEYTLRLTGSNSGVVAEVQVVVATRIADAVVATDELNLRRAPTYDAPVEAVLLRGDDLTALTTNWDNTWMKVATTSGQQGWVVVEWLDLNVSLVDVPFDPEYGVAP
jgi:hypothetical protein